MEPNQVRHLFEIFTAAEGRALHETEATIKLVEAQLGRKLDNTRSVTVRDGVATIPVTGPIFRYANLFTRMSGGSSTGDMMTDLTEAIASPNVNAILLSIDSPGGEATGIHELGDAIFQARTKKPVWAYVEGFGASAAYWIASSAERIVINPTAAVGSIGVVMAVPDRSGKPASEIEFVSSQSPNKRPDPATEAGRAQYQALVDDMAEVFVGTVARNRGVSEDVVLKSFGAGGLKVGRHAVSSKMADKMGDFESTLSALAKEGRRAARNSARMTFDVRESIVAALKGDTV